MPVKVSRRQGIIAFLVVVTLVAIGGSSVLTNNRGGYNAGLYAPVGNSVQPDGVIRLGSTARCDSLDPARSFDPWCGVIFRTYTRNVMAFAGSAGSDGLQVQPDLATQPGTMSPDGLVWTFTLRSDVHWNDGTSITSRDVRHSIERLFAPEISSPVSPSVLCYLSSCSTGLPDYKGPFTKKYGHLKSITTFGKYKIRFHLTRPNAQFDRLLAMPQLAIIERTLEIHLRQQHHTYASNPASSGPFLITLGKGREVARFTRNLQWHQNTDHIRRPIAAGMRWTLFASDILADRALIKGKIDIKLNGGLGSVYRKLALTDAGIKSRVDISPLNATNYLALVPGVQPLDNLACRQAIAYALNKADLRRVRGGQTVSSIASSLIPSGVAGADAGYDPLPSGSQSMGDVDRAKTKLRECGYPDGFEISMAYVNLGVGKATYTSVQTSLARAGIIVDPAPFDDFTTYFAKGAGSPDYVHAHKIGMMLGSWGPDSYTASSFWLPLVDGRAIKSFANQNYPEINEEPVNTLLDQLAVTSDWATQEQISKQLQTFVMDECVYVPYATDHITLYRSQQLAHAYVQHALDGQYDIVNLGVASRN
jgi:peptide/nickel transport system substrate-binding protein